MKLKNKYNPLLNIGIQKISLEANYHYNIIRTIVSPIGSPVEPNITDIPSPNQGDTATIIYIDNTIFYWTYDSESWVFDYKSESNVAFAYNFTDDIPNIPPVLNGGVTPPIGMFMQKILTNDNIEYWINLPIIGWQLIYTITKSYYVPKTVYISKSGNDTTGQIENTKLHFATFMGAYNALPDIGDANYSNKWTIEYIGGYDTSGAGEAIFTENDIYLDNDKGIKFLDLIVPSNVTLQCNATTDKSLFECGTGFSYYLEELNIYGNGTFIRNGNPTDVTKAHVFNVLNLTDLTIHSANIIQNYVGTYCFVDSLNIVKNVNLIKSNAGSIAVNNYQTFINCKLIESEAFTFNSGNGDIFIENCEVSSNLSYNILTTNYSVKAKNAKFITNNYYANLVLYTNNNGYIRDCIFENNQDVNANDCNIFIIRQFANFIELSNSKFYVKNPSIKNNVRLNSNVPSIVPIIDAEITNSVFNAGIENLKNSLSTPKVWRRTYRDDLYDITIGQDYDLYITPYNNYLWTATDTVKLTVQPTTTSPEDLIDLFISAFNTYKTNNPESVLKGLTIVKGQETTGNLNWYFDIIGDNITYRETIDYSNGVNSPQEFTQSLVQGTATGVINVIDIDNLNKNILISPNYGKKGIELTHI